MVAGFSSAGIVRPWVNSYINNNGTTQAGQWVDLFEGAGNVDWADVNSAKVDTRRIDLHYDKTITINSGNSSGVFRTYRRWHPMNKNLVYDDDQDGGKWIHHISPLLTKGVWVTTLC